MTMEIMIAVLAIIVMALSYFSGMQHAIDSKADKLAKGGTLDRQNAKGMRELADKVDVHKYYPSI
ncbi:hypothetical protein BLI708_09375 [Bifidobacterium imperatoris]|uniref:Pilus assembly protein n=2 Tax=Bifidobacterium imperatoris TaxID=2020965 RepID=A0ABX7S242_9BIFI|nr:hypothetical protein [Bifidobacterium imperatoris]QSY57429.1 hypothetical protein BLI708_09375 [Bifidobacterium imperatoris]